MMEETAIYLFPRSGFSRLPASDTLFGALCWGIRAVYGEDQLQRLLTLERAGDGETSPVPFAVSSAFPCVWSNGENPVRFLPMPLLRPVTRDERESLVPAVLDGSDGVRSEGEARTYIASKGKQLRRVAYVSEKAMNRLREGDIGLGDILASLVTPSPRESLRFALWGREPNMCLVTVSERTLLNKLCPTPFVGSDRVRITVDRLGVGTVPGMLGYSPEMFVAHPRVGLWFLLAADGPDWFGPVLRYLEDTGIGANRTVGKNHFRIPLRLVHPYRDLGMEGANGFLSLSRYIPVPGEVMLEARATRRRVATLRQKHEAAVAGAAHYTYKGIIRVLEPGSVFQFGDRKRLYGKLEDTGPRGPKVSGSTYYSGVSVPYFMRLAEEGQYARFSF